MQDRGSRTFDPVGLSSGLIRPDMHKWRDEMLDELVKLSRDPSPEKRRELLRSVTVLFLEDEKIYSDRALILFGEVLRGLLEQVDTEARSDIAGRIAEAPHAGQALHYFLAEGELDVAAPVLRVSTLLDDAILVDIASRKSQGHLEAIAMRDHLSITVTDILVERGDPPVLHAVTRNIGAEISVISFGKIATSAQDNEQLLEAMSYRPDMPNEIADRILHLLTEDAQVRLAALLAADREAVRPLIEQAAKLTKQKKLSRALERLETKGLVQQIRSGDKTLDEVVQWLADHDRVMDLALALGEHAGIDEAIITGAVLKVNAAPVVILVRSLELSEDTVRSVADLRCRRLNLPLTMQEHLLDRWRELDTPTAKRALRFTLVSRAAQQPADHKSAA